MSCRAKLRLGVVGAGGPDWRRAAWGVVGCLVVADVGWARRGVPQAVAEIISKAVAMAATFRDQPAWCEETNFDLQHQQVASYPDWLVFGRGPHRWVNGPSIPVVRRPRH